MTRLRGLGALALALLLPALTMPVGAAAEDALSRLQGPEPVQVDADNLSFDRQAGLYLASGQVAMRKGALTLLADEVRWNPETGEARALGDVLLSDPVGTVRGEELQINLETGRGRLSQGEIFVRERNLHVAGEEIERLGPQTYRISQGTFTTCDAPRPAWKFRASDLTVDTEGFARGRHARFYLKNVPVFYLPYFLYPVKSERESGLLMPRYGYSQERGYELSLAYYQVIARNQDATLYLDYFTDLGLGTGLEYRYVFSRNGGEAKIYHVDGFEGGEGALALDWRHDGQLPGAVRLGADIEYVDDNDYFARFGEVAGEYNKDKTESKIFLARAWGKNNLSGQFKYLQNLDRDTDLTLQRLPEIRLAAIRRRFGDTPLFANLDVAYDHLWREEGQTGQRLSLRPALSAPFSLGPLEVSPEIGFTQRFYDASGRDGDFEQKGLFDFAVRTSSAFARTYSWDGPALRKIQHVISPEIVYSYIPRSDQGNLPVFDRSDRLGPTHRLAYALTNRLTARISPADGADFYHEFLYFRLSQEYDIFESPADPLNPRDNLRPFSDLRAELLLRPTRYGYLDFDARYDFETQAGSGPGFATLTADAGLADEKGNALSFGYRYLRDDLEYVDGRVSTSVLQPVFLGYQQRYDFRTATSLEKLLSVEYRAQCWSVLLTLRDRLEDTEFLVSFALSGIGNVGKFGGSLGSDE